jgi:uncharacterized protein YegP (UPF0339 family)
VPDLHLRAQSEEESPVARRKAGTVKVHVYEDEAREFRWKLKAENGEIISDSAEGYRHKGYCITMAKKLNPGAELVIDDKSED